VRQNKVEQERLVTAEKEIEAFAPSLKAAEERNRTFEVQATHDGEALHVQLERQVLVAEVTALQVAIMQKEKEAEALAEEEEEEDEEEEGKNHAEQVSARQQAEESYSGFNNIQLKEKISARAIGLTHRGYEKLRGPKRFDKAPGRQLHGAEEE